MNDNYIFFRYNNNYNKENIDISPRTHISVNNSKENTNTTGNIIKKDSKTKIKKLDSVEFGLQKLISLGRQTKKFIPSRESILYKKKLITSSNYFKTKSVKKMTPFQIYEKNKKLFELSLKKNSKKTLNLKSFNSEEFNKNNYYNFKHRTNIFSTPIRHFNTISCNFKNKLLKSMFEKNKIKIQTINDNNYSKPKNEKYLLSYGNDYNNKSKKNKFINDYYIGKEKIISLKKLNPKKKRINELLLCNNKNTYTDVNFQKNKGVQNINRDYNINDFCNNIYSQIPLIELDSINFANRKFDNLFINKIYNKYKNKN